MASNQESKTKEEKTAENNNIKQETKPTNNSNVLHWILGIFLVLVIIGFIASMAGFAHYVRNHRNSGIVTPNGYGGFMERGFGRHRMMGGAIYNSNQVAISGVVTNVNGSSFTLSGNGTTNSVQTNSSTQYSGASKVSVNDSVTVLGNTNNSTFTASQVYINNTQ